MWWTLFLSFSLSLFLLNLYTLRCISALLLLLLFSKSAWHEWKQLKPEKRLSKTQWMDFFKKGGGGGERKEGVHEKGGEINHRFFFPYPAMSMQRHPPHHQPSYFLTPKVAANMCKSASPAANCSLRRLDEDPHPLPTSSRLRERGSGEGDSADHTLYTSGDVLQGF